MRGTRQLGYPKWPNAIPGESVPLDILFTRTYDYDAFALSHVVPDGQPAYRLTKDYEGPLRFALIFADLDAHDLHADLLAEWKATERQRALKLFESKPGLLYLTRGGLRMVWRCDLARDDYEPYCQAWYDELERRGFRGVDHSAASFGRHMRLPFVVRDGKPERPTLEGELAYLQSFDPGVISKKIRRHRPTRARAQTPGVVSDPTLRRAIDLGLAAHIGADTYAVVCPTRPHRGGLTSKTVVLPDGRFKCMSPDCVHVRYDDWARSVPCPYVTIQAAEEAIVAALRRGGVGGRWVVVDVPPGIGKSHIARLLLAQGALHEGMPSALLCPTNALATQHRVACGAQQIAGVRADIPGREVCQQLPTVNALHALGLSSKYACVSCPHAPECTVADPIGDKRQGVVTTHAMLHRFEAGRTNLIFDEMPEISEAFLITVADIRPALEACARDWRDGIAAWAYSLAAGLPDERAREQARLLPAIPETHKQASYGLHFNGERMRKTFAPLQTAVRLREAAEASAIFEFSMGCVKVTKLSRTLEHIRTHGGAHLAAGASETICKAIRQDVEFIRLSVDDPPHGISRTLIKMANSSTGRLKLDTQRLADIVQDLLMRARNAKLAIFSAMSIEPTIRELAPEALTGHYGALRGLDHFMGADVFATIGDHYTNIDAVDDEAKFLGIDARALSLEQVQTELEQAHGRARDLRRGTRAIHLHYGSVWPNRWHPGNTVVQSFKAVSARIHTAPTI